MADEKILIAIHEQSEVVQAVIAAHYNKTCTEIVKEISYLLALLIAYTSKHL